MGCTLGDIVIFPRVPANEIAINGLEFVMLHEEQHVVGVVEQGREAVAA
jgi:co-chaperonin GroES (HSP10)